MNLSVKYLFLYLNVRYHCPIFGPKLVPLADVTVPVFDFNSLGFCGNELNNFAT